jgi:hypothetical protein
VSGSLADRISALLARHRPASLLIIGEPPPLPAEAPAATHIAVESAARELEGLGRFDFAILGEVAERLPADETAALLGRLKNLHTDRFLLLVNPARSSLDRDALLGLALLPLEAAADDRQAWLYDLDRYNPEREWNNPADWAHPENFDRFRW